MSNHTSGAADLPIALRMALDCEALDLDGIAVELRRLHALAAGQAVAPAEPTSDELRAIAREARNSSGSASDDCGSAMYVLYGWRAAMSKVAPPAMDGEVVVTTDQQGRCIAVTRQDDEGRVLKIIWRAMDGGEDAEQERPVQRMEGWTDTRYIAELENVACLLRRDLEKLHRVREALSEKGGR